MMTTVDVVRMNPVAQVVQVVVRAIQVVVVINQPPLCIYIICTILLIMMLVCIYYILRVSVGCGSYGFGGGDD